MSNADGGTSNDAGQTTGNFPQWMASLPDAHKQNQSFAQFQEPSQAWDKLNTVMQHEADGKLLTIPGEDARPEQKAAFNTALGIPETADGYKFDKPELPEGMEYDSNQEAVFRDIFHKHQIPAEKAAALYAEYNAMAGQGFTAQQKEKTDTAAAEAKATEEAINALKDAWKGDDFKVNSEMSHRAFVKGFDGDEAGLKEAKKFLLENKVGGVALGDHPMFLKVFHRFASLTADDSANAGRESGADFQLSEEQAAAKRFPNTNFKKT